MKKLIAMLLALVAICSLVGCANTDAGNNTTTAATTEVKIQNNAGATLPETGGMGTTMFYIFGAVMLLGAAVLLVTKRRMNYAE